MFTTGFLLGNMLMATCRQRVQGRGAHVQMCQQRPQEPKISSNFLPAAPKSLASLLCHGILEVTLCVGKGISQTKVSPVIAELLTQRFLHPALGRRLLAIQRTPHVGVVCPIWPHVEHHQTIAHELEVTMRWRNWRESGG